MFKWRVDDPELQAKPGPNGLQRKPILRRKSSNHSGYEGANQRKKNWDDGTKPKAHDASDAGTLPYEKPQSSSSIRQKPLITWSDIYTAYASIPGYRALRNKKTGSWFLSALYEVCSKYASTTHLEELMKHVHAEVMGKSANDGEKQTPSTDSAGWTKKLYFNPKKFVDSWPEKTVSNSAL
ncbi:hypothetical protein MTO96_040335 [Rhipicephalus appendiculatus]